jgi:hypothetical protein
MPIQPKSTCNVGSLNDADKGYDRGRFFGGLGEDEAEIGVSPITPWRDPPFDITCFDHDTAPWCALFIGKAQTGCQLDSLRFTAEYCAYHT